MSLSEPFYETDYRTPFADGRRERSRSNHAKIIAAGIDLLGKGEYAPSAARVAEVAGVGIRSVFRHFEDMDTLYRQLGAEVELKVWPIMLQQLEGEDCLPRKASHDDLRDHLSLSNSRRLTAF